MEKLCCDICGGTLVMQSGGKTAVCDSCGMQYSTERMREKVQEIKGVVSIEGTVRTQDADFIIRGGVLERYNGNDIHVVIPDSVVKIGEKAFDNCPGIRSVIFPHNVTEIAPYAFRGCQSLEDIKLSNTLVEIGRYSFQGCCALKQISLPETVKTIGGYAFEDCTSLEVINIPDSVQHDGSYGDMRGVFWNCPALREIKISEEQKEKLFIHKSYDGKRYLHADIFLDGDEDGHYHRKHGSWYANLDRELEGERVRIDQAKCRAEGKCQYCGGYFSGVFTKKCVRCGKPKDY